MAAIQWFVLASLSLVLVFPAGTSFSVKRRKPLAIIKEINKKGPYLGLITVYPPEENAFFADGSFKNDSKYPYVDLSGRRFRVGMIENKRVIYVRCGVGLVNAAAATQQMLDYFNIKGLIHFGISGNTNSSLSIGDVTIPKQFANTGLWDWLKPNATVPQNDVAKLDVDNYNVPKGGNNTLGRIAYSPEQFYSEAGEPNTAQQVLWFQVTNNWLQLATTLQGMQLEQCVNSSLCLETKPKVVVGLKGSTANTFLDNAAYRDFLFQTFGVSSADMESTAVVMVRTANKARAKLIVVMTHGGSTAKLVAKYRPAVPILSVVVPVLTMDSFDWSISDETPARQSLVYRGLIPVLAEGAAC